MAERCPVEANVAGSIPVSHPRGKTMKSIMEIKSFLIAGGNRTSLVWDCPKENRLEISNKLLSSEEQVGFIDETKDKIPYLAMMGNELCINAMIALGYALMGNGTFYASGIPDPVRFSNTKNDTTITLPITYTHVDNFVLFEGIGYLCTTKNTKPTKNELKKLAEKYNLPAFGYAVYTNNVLNPYVYVRDVHSYFLETACGSGSIAIAIMTGRENITQRTGETIRVKILKDNISVTANVTEVNACLNNTFLLP